ncbi:primase 1D-like protein [Ectopseudomonas mendocina]|uniref:primase 1D-like protein n=1 Tax=Ectopseudomonas mendocina TaxID=300 RepID=UPI0009BD1A6E|nr:hypothetical protein [Pseudomonas mendocina]
MIGSDHPFHFLSSLFDSEDSSFCFSKYIYLPDSPLDEREIFSIRGIDITLPLVEQIIASLGADQELAIHSTVRLKGRNYHIPMIDFSMTEDIGGKVFDRMSRYLNKSLLLNMAFYKSGRSFHAYSTTLLTPKEWIDFMGRLLLINPANKESIVDSRWIGHRLIGGFGSLRWSNNSGTYLGSPARTKFPC